jgi:hypothetical protein
MVSSIRFYYCTDAPHIPTMMYEDSFSSFELRPRLVLSVIRFNASSADEPSKTWGSLDKLDPRETGRREGFR